MKTAKNLPAGLAAEVLDALIQLRREGDPKAIFGATDLVLR
jgi:hypothetical protein